MSWSFRLLRVAGIDVKIHVTFLLLLGFYAYQGLLEGGPTGALASTTFVLLLFLCVLLHEFGHAFAARAYGIRTPDITLLPIGGVARLERMPSTPTQELVVAVAGPLVNVVIAILLWAGLGFPSRLADFIVFDRPLSSLAIQLLNVNIALVLFNLLPAFPMDGGRVLRALLAMRLDHVKATRIAGRVGQVMAGLFVLAGFVGIPGLLAPNFFLGLIGIFIFMGAQQEITFAAMRSAVTGLRVADAMITRFQTLPAHMTVAAAAAEALRDIQSVYAVTDDHLRIRGLISRNDLLVAGAGAEAPRPLESVATPVPSVAAGASFDEAFAAMQQSGQAVLPVVNPAGQIVGLVSLNLLRERAKLRTA